MSEKKAIAISLASAIAAEIGAANLDQETALMAFGMATGVLLSKERIVKLMEAPEVISALSKNPSASVKLPELTDEEVDFAIRAFSSGLAHRHSVQLLEKDGGQPNVPSPLAS